MVTRGADRSADSSQLEGHWEEDGKIIVGIDIGTTQSGVALACLEKGEKKVVHRIENWPGQDQANASSKIPTVVWYNTETKKAESFGAEAMSRETYNDGMDNKWFLAKNFKLHLQPRELRESSMEMVPLPPGISLIQIYSDFLSYLLKHTQAFVERRILLGRHMWEKYNSTMQITIAHPNGWGTPEQDFLRKAIVNTGFVSEDSASNQVHFVTEAEASVHYCLHHSNLNRKLQDGTRIAVCDAGGSTVDTTLYSVVSSSGPAVRLREIRMSSSVQAGGILVNIEFDKFMRKTLGPLYLSQEQIDEITATGVEDFENHEKRNFGNPNRLSTSSQQALIKVGSSDFTDSTTPIKISRGCMRVPSSVIKECFDVCVRLILSDLDKQLKDSGVQHILLVGGFGDSRYLGSQIESCYNTTSCEVVLANDHTSKAVADGSVIWSMLCSVESRTPIRSIGMICARFVDPCSPEAIGRDMYLGPQGLPVIPGGWCQIVKKGVPVNSEEVYRDSFRHISLENNPIIPVNMDLYSYSGGDEPTWAFDKNENLMPEFQKVCTIAAELHSLGGALTKQTGLLGADFWEIKIDVCIHFGATELKAHLEWEKDGVIHKSGAAVIPGNPIEF